MPEPRGMTLSRPFAGYFCCWLCIPCLPLINPSISRTPSCSQPRRSVAHVSSLAYMILTSPYTHTLSHTSPDTLTSTLTCLTARPTLVRDMGLTLRHGRSTVVLGLLVIGGLTLLCLRQASVIPSLPLSTLRQTALTSRIPADLINAKVTLHDVIDNVASTIAASASRFDPAEAYRDLGFKLGETTIEGYTSDLSSTFAEYFSNASQTDLLHSSLSYLSLVPPPSLPVPKTIYTTDRHPPSEFPVQFHSWAQMNPEWRTMFVDDEAMDEWLESSFRGGEGVVREMKALMDGHGIIRADIFR